jgi:hypothetical protein
LDEDDEVAMESTLWTSGSATMPPSSSTEHSIKDCPPPNEKQADNLERPGIIFAEKNLSFYQERRSGIRIGMLRFRACLAVAGQLAGSAEARERWGN